METAWIQVFIMTLTQCVAPPDKMVCQEETVEYRFASEADCDRALVQMLDYAERADNVLVNRQKSMCRAAAQESRVYASGEEANPASGVDDGFVLIDGKTPPTDFMQASHQERLSALQECEQTGGAAPCKIGQIIIEPATEKKLEVWKRQR